MEKKNVSWRVLIYADAKWGIACWISFEAHFRALVSTKVVGKHLQNDYSVPDSVRAFQSTQMSIKSFHPSQDLPS